MTFTSDQAKAIELLESGKNLFITGEAGSGKSYVIRHFMRDQDPKLFPILASTGAAAVLVGGRTFHSFMGLGIIEGGFQKTLERALSDKRLRKRLKDAKGFILDEVSMISGPTLALAEKICREIRANELPWGGLRVIAVGDFSQLPPVQPGSTKRSWAFLDPVWQFTDFETVVLRQNMRTNDTEFLSILNDVRRGKVNDRVTTFLNQRKMISEFTGTRLFPLRKQTDSFNHLELEKIEGEEFVFPTIYSGVEKSVEQLKKHSPLSDELRLKNNALVMLRQNDPKMRYVNGSTGYVRNIKKSNILIELLNGRLVDIEPVSFSLLNAEGISVASAMNFPLSLAYAATIHKAQGMTLDRLVVNLNALWEPGQAYVALSRVMDPSQLRVEGWQAQSIKADPLVEKFYEQFL